MQSVEKPKKNFFFENSMAQEKSADSEDNTGLRMLTLIASKKKKK